MTLTQAIITYATVWWLIFFMALPVGVRTDSHVTPGLAPSAPKRPHLKWKALIVTVIAALVTWGAHMILQAELLRIEPY